MPFSYGCSTDSPPRRDAREAGQLERVTVTLAVTRTRPRLCASDHRVDTGSRTQASAGTLHKLTFLRRHPLFGQLSPESIEHLGSYMKRQSLPRGTAIFAKDDPATGLLGVLAGTVKISVPSADGREIVLNIMREGDIFGAISALDSRPRGADATAMTDCELIVIERRDFIPFLHGQPDLCMHVIDLLCSRVRRRTEQIQDVTFLDLPTRLAKALLRLAADAQPPGSAPKVVITQSEISQIIGRSREMTNKQLRAWASDGLIRLERGAIVLLNRDKLAEIVAQEVGRDRCAAD
jgi:CRP/FNR family transcriptional regulator, cyclic AMP receptor protein